MLRARRVATAAVVVSVLAFASASPAIADSKNESPRKHAVECAQVASKQEKIQGKIDQISGRKASSDPEVQASRQAKLAKLRNRLARAADGC